MREAGRLAAEVLDMIGDHVQPGVTTEDLDRLCHEHIVEVQKAIPANVNYRGFPKTICASVNHVVCHGIPNEKLLKAGDIVNIDVTVIRDGFHGDTSRMYFVGKPAGPGQRLVDVLFRGMWRGIRAVRPGARSATSATRSSNSSRERGLLVVREYCGHGIGRVYHEDPQVLHYGEPGTGMAAAEGMTFTIEPMVNAGKRHVRLLPDGWTVVTKDHSLSAQWEHTVPTTWNRTSRKVRAGCATCTPWAGWRSVCTALRAERAAGAGRAGCRRVRHPRHAAALAVAPALRPAPGGRAARRAPAVRLPEAAGRAPRPDG
jgi:methionyl aminopeptidase